VYGGDPEGVGVEEEEENHAEGHEVHVDEEEDAAVIEAPTALHAANRVSRAGGGGEGWEDKHGGAVDLGEAREKDGCEQTGQDKQNAAEEGSLARIENTGRHTDLINLFDSMLPGFSSDSSGLLMGGLVLGEDKEVAKSDRSDHCRFFWDGREFIWEPSRCLPALLRGRQPELRLERLEAAGFSIRRWLPRRLRGGRG
jgi:hypothetical protein